MEPEAALRLAFDAADADADGLLSLEDFEMLCESLPVPEKEKKQLFRSLDTDRDGMLSFADLTAHFAAISGRTARRRPTVCKRVSGDFDSEAINAGLQEQAHSAVASKRKAATALAAVASLEEELKVTREGWDGAKMRLQETEHAREREAAEFRKHEAHHRVDVADLKAALAEVELDRDRLRTELQSATARERQLVQNNEELAQEARRTAACLEDKAREEAQLSGQLREERERTQGLLTALQQGHTSEVTAQGQLQAEIAAEEELREQLEWHKSELARCKSEVAVLVEVTAELEAAAVTCSCGVGEQQRRHRAANRRRSRSQSPPASAPRRPATPLGATTEPLRLSSAARRRLGRGALGRRRRADGAERGVAVGLGRGAHEPEAVQDAARGRHQAHARRVAAAAAAGGGRRAPPPPPPAAAGAPPPRAAQGHGGGAAAEGGRGGVRAVHFADARGGGGAVPRADARRQRAGLGARGRAAAAAAAARPRRGRWRPPRGGLRRGLGAAARGEAPLIRYAPQFQICIKRSQNPNARVKSQGQYAYRTKQI